MTNEKGKWARLFFGLAMISILLGSAAYAEVLRLRVKAAVANIRSEPDVTKPVISQVSLGTVVQAEGKEGDWYVVYVPSGGKTVNGYIHKNVVEVIAAGSAEPPKYEDSQYQAQRTRPETRRVPLLAGEKRFSLNVMGGAGLTIATIWKDLEIEPYWLLDWNKFHWRITAQGVYRFSSALNIGLEYGWNSYYYCWWKAPGYYGHERYVVASDLCVVVESDWGKHFFTQAGLGFFFVEDDDTYFGYFLAVGGRIPVAKGVMIPIMIRYDQLRSSLSTVALLVGVSIKLF